MKNLLLRPLIRTRMVLTSREGASRQIRRCLLDYRGLYAGVGEEEARRPVRVPPMTGIDEEMRTWSLFQILEHQVIVNRSITAIVRALSLGEEPGGEGAIDPKRGVLPSEAPGPEQLGAFRESVERHLEVVATLPGLRGTRRKEHPVFGRLDAHDWHAMFALHLQIHLWQAEEVVRRMPDAGG
jgi:hypothetical protein